MSAKTGINLGDTWNCDLKLINANFTGTAYTPVNIVSFQAMSCRAEIMKIEEQRITKSAHEHALNDPPPTGQGPIGCWVGSYYHYEVQIIAPEMMGEYIIPLYIWLGDNWSPIINIPNLGFPTGSVVCDTDEFILNVSISVNGLFLKGQMEDLSPDDRNILDFTDEAVGYKWYADGNTTSSITISGGGISETRTGNWGSWSEDEEVDILVGDTFGCQYSIGLKVGYEGYQFAAISNIKWGSRGSISTSGIEKLYSTNGSTWSRTPASDNYWYFYNDQNAIIPMRHGTTITTGCSWLGTSLTPLIVTYKMDGDSVGNFDQDGESSSLVFLSNYIIWDDENNYHLEPVSNGLTVVSGASSWNQNYPYEWKKLTSRDIVVYEREAERIANYEDLGENVGMAQDDAQCHIPIPRLDATNMVLSSYGNTIWANFGTLTHVVSQSVNDPDTISRPSNWESSSITVDPADNDVWTLGVNSTDNIVHRDLKTKYYLRMERLSGGYVPGKEYGEPWIWAFKSNIDLDDDPDWNFEEDITNFTNYNYFIIDIDSEIDGTITMKIDYRVPSISDPFYTCASYRWNEFECTYEYYSLSWTFDVVVGNNKIYLDKTINDDEIDPFGPFRPQIVDTITFYLPDNNNIIQKNIILNDIILTLDTGGNDRTEPSTHVEIRNKRNWKWYENYSVGIHGYIDGNPSLEIDYGHTINKELGIPSTQRIEHCPTTEDQSSRLDAARPLSSFMDIDYQEGWEATSYYDTVKNSSGNKDIYGNYLVGTFYFWDLIQDFSQKTATTTYLNGNKNVGIYRIPAGIECSIWVCKHPRGRLHGIAYNQERTERLRNTSDAVNIYGRHTGDSWVLIQNGINTDQHGRFYTWGLHEKDWTYNYNGGGSSFTVYTREYTYNNLNFEILTMPNFVEGPMGSITLSYVNLANNKIYSKRKMGPKAEYKEKVYVKNGFYPCLTMDKKSVMVYQTETSNVAFVQSKKFGTIWEDIGMSQVGTHPSMVDKNGIQYLTHYISGIGQVIKRSQDYFVTKMSYDPNNLTTTSSVITPFSDAERAAFIRLTTDGNHLIVAVPAYGSIVLYKSKNSGKDWEEIV